MEYQKITNLLDDTTNQSSKFRAKNWVGISDESRGAYNNNIKMSLTQSNLCDYCDACIHVEAPITVQTWQLQVQL